MDIEVTVLNFAPEFTVDSLPPLSMAVGTIKTQSITCFSDYEDHKIIMTVSQIDNFGNAISNSWV
jgi:hypothetical protein